MTVRGPCLIFCETLLTSTLSDGKQAKVAAKYIGDKVQVVIDGERALSCRLSNTSNFYTSDGKQAKVATKEIGDKVQVVIDGA